MMSDLPSSNDTAPPAPTDESKPARQPLRNDSRETTRGDDREGSIGRSLRSLLRGLTRSRNGEHLRDTIEELIDEDQEHEASIAPDERRLLKNILDLHEATARDVMVPRADIVSVDANIALPDLIKLLNAESHSRLPVYRGSLDDIVGFIHIKDVLPYWGSRKVFKLEKIARKVIFAAPSMGVLDLLAQMRDTRIHLALVVDEYGGIDGLVTIEDLVEEIVGEIEDEHDDLCAPRMDVVRSGVLRADARVTVESFEERFGEILTEDEREDVDTLGGLVFHLAGRVPSRGELIRHSSGLEFEVVDADPRRIRTVRVRNLPAPLAKPSRGSESKAGSTP